MIGGSNKLIGLPEAAQFLDVSERTLRREWETWGLKAIRVGTRLKFRERDIAAWIEGQEAR